jgi:enoyl-CoA hydratase/carnithine racemase
VTDYENVTLTTPEDGILVATLDRPDTYNALTLSMFPSLTALFRDVAADRSVRAIVLTGAGKGFCSGLDLVDAATLTTYSANRYVDLQQKLGAVAAGMRRCTTPIIAAVNGAAAGAGFSLALAADIRIASTAAKFNAAFIRIGLTGGDVGSSYLLPRIVGLGVATEILMTGRFVLPEEAQRIGLVTSVVEPEALMEAALATARSIAANTPLGIRLTKQVIQTNVDAPSIEAARELESRNQTLAVGNADMQEALNAFLEKRPPKFTDQ